jgi:hypothetical protein
MGEYMQNMPGGQAKTTACEVTTICYAFSNVSRADRHRRTIRREPSGTKYVAIFVDHATLYCELAAIKNCGAVTVATILVDQWCSRYGFSRQLITDLGPCYANELMRTVCTLLNVKLGHCTPQHHMANSRAEHMAKVISRNLGLLTEKQDSWEMYLPNIALAHRVTKIISFGLSPFESLFLPPRAQFRIKHF